MNVGQFSRFVFSIVILSIGSLLLNCNGSSGDGGFAPIITDVRLYNANEPYTPTYSFDIGDEGNIEVDVTDQDSDITTLWSSEYFPSDSTTPYNGPIEFPLPSQSGVDMTYSFIDPLTIEGPAGNWRMEFQIEDAQGNKSNVFTVYCVVH